MPEGEKPEGEKPEGEESEGDDTLADIAGKVWEAAAGDDGELDGDEAMKMARKVCDMKGWEVTDDELEEWIDEVGEEIDTDMSGTISGEEALAAWDAMIGEMELETDEIAELAVDFMETGDKDGKISKDEAKQVAGALGLDVSEEEIEAAIDELDQDGDEMLSVKEVGDLLAA